MSIQIIDNFELNSSKPIDNRFVVGPNSFYVNRDDIPWKYAGMRIWDLNDGPNGTPYVWTGTTYSSENTINIGGFGTTNYLARFIAPTTLGNSIIYDNGLYIGINNSSPVYTLDVGGSIRTSVYFYGDGTFITAVNATNITQGTLTLNRIQNTSSPGFFLTSGIGGAGQVTWANPTAVNVGSATQLSNTRTLWGQPFNGTQNVTGNIDVDGNVSNVNILKLKNVNNGLLSVVYSSTSNINRTVSFPNMNGNRTVALLENSQTFTAVNTFNQFTNFDDNVQITGTSSLFGKLTVTVTETLNLPPPIGPVSVTTKSLRVLLGAVGIGDDIGNPYIVGLGSTNAYTFKDDTDSGIFRVAPTNSTQSSIRMLSDSKIQMILGNNISPTHSTAVEQYTTPGIAMMSLLDVWYISDFDLLGAIPKFVWLDRTFNSVATDLPYTFDPAGTSGPGSFPAQAQAGNAATNYDRMVVISTSGRTAAYVYLETVPNSGLYYQLNFIFKDSNFPLIIPAGRKWKVMMLRAFGDQVTDESATYTVANAQSNDDKVRFVSYKWGMS